MSEEKFIELVEEFINAIKSGNNKKAHTKMILIEIAIDEYKRMAINDPAAAER